ncbi:hypothetical protein Tco_1194136 [Tanacetum coccineum]
MHLLESEDTGAAHLSKIKTRPEWLKPLLEEETSETPEPDWVVLQMTYLRLRTTGLMQWPKRIKIQQKTCYFGKLEIWPPSSNGIANGLGRRISSKLTLKKAWSVHIQAESGLLSRLRLEELVPSLWTESESVYDISSAYGISHWWFKRKEFYIVRHSAPSDHNAVRSHMKILSVVSLKTYSRYGYTFLKEIILRRADYKEYKISEADFKNLHPSDFEDLYLLNLQGKLNHLSGSDKVHLSTTVNLWTRNIAIRKQVEDLQLGIESYQTKLNITQPR